MYRESSHQPLLNTEYYQNPIVSGDWPDPAVIRDGDEYYLVTSTARYYPPLTILHSGDLINWEPLCSPIPHSQMDVWAPDIVKYQGLYYIYFSANGSNFVIYSKHIYRGWSTPIDLKIDHIDPGHCEENGKRYLMLSDGYIAPLSDDGLRVIGDMVQVIQASPIPDEWDVEGAFPESPKVIRHQGYYYLTYADGGTGGPATAHMVMSARSKSLFGPWEFSPYNPIVHTWSRDEKWCAKGHGHLIDDTAGNWWIIYHAYQNGAMTLGRSLLIEPIEWLDSGWFQLKKDGLCDQPRKRPSGEEFHTDWTLSDSFMEPNMKAAWKMFGINDFSRAKSGNGRLALAGRGSHPGESGPLVISAGDLSYVVSVKLFPSDCDESGIILIYNEKHYAAAGWNGKVLRLYRNGCPHKAFQVEGSSLTLYLRNNRHYVAFYYSVDGCTIKKLNYVMNTQSMDAAAYDGFNSLRPGLYAQGRGTAVFSDFQYQTRHSLLL